MNGKTNNNQLWQQPTMMQTSKPKHTMVTQATFYMKIEPVAAKENDLS